MDLIYETNPSLKYLSVISVLFKLIEDISQKLDVLVHTHFTVIIL